jgi:hypothetical protein
MKVSAIGEEVFLFGGERAISELLMGEFLVEAYWSGSEMLLGRSYCGACALAMLSHMRGSRAMCHQ